MSCHAPEGFSGDSTVDPEQFADENDEKHDFNRFVLTGNQTGDFNVTRAMINNLCAPNPGDNDLLLRPSSDNIAPNLPHPQILVDINEPQVPLSRYFQTTVKIPPIRQYLTGLAWGQLVIQPV